MPAESAKPTITSLTGVGLVRVVDDSAGTPLSRSITPANLAADTAFADKFVQVVGDTMTGDLFVSKSNARLVLNDTGTGTYGSIQWQDGGVNRWALYRVEADGRLLITRYDSGGIGLDNPLVLNADGTISMVGAGSVALPTVSTDLVVSKSSAIVDIDDTGTGTVGVLRYSDNGTTRWAIRRVKSSGRLTIDRYDGAGAFQDTPLLIESTGEINLQQSPNVLVPAADGAGQAAQVTAYDAALGRLSIGGHEVGDTGWRNVAASLQNGWTGTIRIRRTGDVVEMQIAPIVATSATSDTFLTHTLLGTGFSPRSGVGWQSIVSTVSAYFRQVSGNLEIVNRATGTYYATLVWTTTDAWPTSLPGTAA